MGSRHGTQLVRLGSYYLMGHLANPQLPRLQLRGTQNGMHFLMVMGGLPQLQMSLGDMA